MKNPRLQRDLVQFDERKPGVEVSRRTSTRKKSHLKTRKNIKILDSFVIIITVFLLRHQRERMEKEGESSGSLSLREV